MLDKLYTGGYAAHEHLVSKLAFRPQFALIPPLPPRALNFHETSFRFDPSFQRDYLYFYILKLRRVLKFVALGRTLLLLFEPDRKL